jgi:hypothetical protein
MSKLVDLIQGVLPVAFVLSLLGVGWFWLSIFAAGMSDASPPEGGIGLTGALLVTAIPVALLIAWWLTCASAG